jgi:hydrogenase maturation protease
MLTASIPGRGMKTLILGLGNPLLRDDSVGLQVIKQLREILADHPEIEIDEDYWGGLRLMEHMVGYDRAIIVDAICTDAPAGTIHVLSPDDIPTQRSVSAHDVNLPTALELGHQAGAHLPSTENIILIGIEAEDVQTFEESLSPTVEAVLPDAIHKIFSILEIE